MQNDPTTTVSVDNVENLTDDQLRDLVVRQAQEIETMRKESNSLIRAVLRESGHDVATMDQQLRKSIVDDAETAIKRVIAMHTNPGSVADDEVPAFSSERARLVHELESIWSGTEQARRDNVLDNDYVLYRRLRGLIHDGDLTDARNVTKAEKGLKDLKRFVDVLNAHHGEPQHTDAFALAYGADKPQFSPATRYQNE